MATPVRTGVCERVCGFECGLECAIGYGMEFVDGIAKFEKCERSEEFVKLDKSGRLEKLMRFDKFECCPEDNVGEAVDDAEHVE